MKNLLTRTLSGAVFLALFLTALLWHPAAYAVLFLFAVTVMMTEYLRITVGPHEKAAKAIAPGPSPSCWSSYAPVTA